MIRFIIIDIGYYVNSNIQYISYIFNENLCIAGDKWGVLGKQTKLYSLYG